MSTELKDDNLKQSFEAAQLEKLNLEILALKKKSPWRETLLQLLPAVTVFLALAGFFYGLYQSREAEKKSRLAEHAGQMLKIQEQIRSDLEQIVQFPTDKKQTVSRVSFLLLDLDNLLKPNLSDAESIAKDRRRISDLLAQLISDDTNLSERRNVGFALTVAKRWGDYGEGLKANQNLLQNILSNHCDALEGLYKKAPEYFGQFKYTDQTRSEIDEPDVKPLPDAAIARHFEDIVGSYARHLELIQDPNSKQLAIKHFQVATCNRDLTQQEFGTSFDPKQDPSEFSSCVK